MTNQERNRRQTQGRRLKAARVAYADLSLRGMADAISEHWTQFGTEPVSADFVRRIERGERDAEYGYIAAVAAVAGLPLESLLDRDPDHPTVRAIPGKRNPATLTPVAPLHALPVAA